jgi:hypothetical protein
MTERLRGQAEKCRRLAAIVGDIEIERRLIALADEYEAKAVQADAHAASSKVC